MGLFDGTNLYIQSGAAKLLLDEAGFRDPDGDGPRMRFRSLLSYKLSGSSIAGRQYAGVIQNYPEGSRGSGRDSNAGTEHAL